MSEIELLAPAKNLECGKIAIDCGADAVYIGSPRFSARSAAHNSMEDVKELVKYAHLFHARVYVALNTILYDSEVDEAVKLIWELYEAGVDALIIQDMGLLECDLPPIPVHASTQTNNRTVDKVKFLEEVGFQQVVLARELSLEQIKEIKANTSVPLEYFVHGALCVSYSGQCYISQAKTGRSANRGDCSQFCRHSYTMYDSNNAVMAENKHLLSVKDLNLSDRLEDLIDAGVTSFKIEGRLKDASYVKNVTSHYRKELDTIIAKRNDVKHISSGKVTFPYETDLTKTFNRGPSKYFLDGRKFEMANHLSPKNVGEPVGVIERSFAGHARLKSEADLSNGDGLSFFDSNNELVGVRLSRIEGKQLEFNSDIVIPSGTQLYRNFDHNFNKLLLATEAKRQIDISFQLKENGDTFLLTVTDEDDISTSQEIDFEKQLAKNVEKAQCSIEKALSKTGGTAFFVTNVDIDLSQMYFFPNAVLNDARRSVLEKFTQLRIEKHHIPYEKIEPTEHPYVESESSYLDNICNEKAKAFYARHGVNVQAMAYEYDNPDAELPLMITKYCIRYEMNMCKRFQKNTQGAEFSEPFFLEDDKHKFRLHFDCQKCEMHVLG